MPELYLGVHRGERLPIYLAIIDAGGQFVEQPPNSPTIEIVYIDPNSHERVNSVPITIMNEIEPGRYFYTNLTFKF